MREVRAKIHSYVKQGGVKPAAAPEKSKLMKGLDVFTGKAPLPEFGAKSSSASAASASPTAAAAVSSPPYVFTPSLCVFLPELCDVCFVMWTLFYADTSADWKMTMLDLL